MIRWSLEGIIVTLEQHDYCTIPVICAIQYRGGTHMLRHMGMCHQNGLLFHQKSLDMGPNLVKKSLEEGPISQILPKNCKISCFWNRKTLRKGSRFAKISKKLSNQPFFEWEKSYTVRLLFKKFTQHYETYEPTNCCVKIIHNLCKTVHNLCNFFTQQLVGSYVSQCHVKF